MTTFLWVVVGFIVACWIISKFNKLGMLRKRVRETRKELKERLEAQWGLIYGIINTTRGYVPTEALLYDRAEHNVVVAQTAAAQRGCISLDAIEGEIKSQIARLFAIGRSSPQCRDSVNFLDLQTKFTNAWTAIRNAQRCHSAAVTNLNQALDVFPQSLVARLLGLEEEVALLSDRLIEE